MVKMVERGWGAADPQQRCGSLKAPSTSRAKTDVRPLLGARPFGQGAARAGAYLPPSPQRGARAPAISVTVPIFSRASSGGGGPARLASPRPRPRACTPHRHENRRAAATPWPAAALSNDSQKRCKRKCPATPSAACMARAAPRCRAAGQSQNGAEPRRSLRCSAAAACCAARVTATAARQGFELGRAAQTRSEGKAASLDAFFAPPRRLGRLARAEAERVRIAAPTEKRAARRCPLRAQARTRVMGARGTAASGAPWPRRAGPVPQDGGWQR
jgi:hypothetical protein